MEISFDNKNFENIIGERDSNPRYPLGTTAFRVQRIQPDSAISPNIVLN